MPEPYWSVPPLWRGMTAVILGGGPSLTQDQVDYCRGKGPVIAVNDSHRLAPWAQLLYFCDARWYGWHKQDVDAFPGVKATLENSIPGVYRLRRNTPDGKPQGGLCDEPDGVNTGRSSVYQAINVAVHLGVSTIVLLGCDMKVQPDKSNWFGSHPKPTDPEVFRNMMLPCYRTLPEALKERRIRLINATPGGELNCFERMPLERALCAPAC